MDAASLSDFRLQAQESLEALWSATIHLPGVAEPIVCAGGTLNQTGPALLIGGLVPEYAVNFRVRKTLLATAPELGVRLTFAGTEYRILRVVNAPSDVAYFIGADHPEK